MTGFESADRVYDSVPVKDTDGALVFDCPDCPTKVFDNGGSIFGASLCPECSDYASAILSLQALQEAKR